MNKGEFIKAYADKAGFTAKEANVAFDAFFEVVKDVMKKGEKIQIVGIGSFELKKKAARQGINPQTKAVVKIAACKVPTFKFGKAFKDLFN